MLGTILKTAAVLTAQNILTVGANYATDTLINAYAAPDLKDYKTEEEKQKKVESFEKNKAIAIKTLNCLEAGAICTGSAFIVNSIGNAAEGGSKDKDRTSSLGYASALIGRDFFV